MDFQSSTYTSRYSASYTPPPTIYGPKPEVFASPDRLGSPLHDRLGSPQQQRPHSPATSTETVSTTVVRSGAIKVPRTFAQWTAEAQAATAEIQRNGALTPLTWVYVDGHNIPPNAVVAGDDRGKPLYIARTFFEGTLQVGKAGHHLRLGATIPLKGREVEVKTFEVLVAAFTPTRWVYQSSQATIGLERQLADMTVTQTTEMTLERRLKEMKVVVIVDDSLSMDGQPWNDAGSALADVADMARQYEAEGIDIFFLNNEHYLLDVREKAAVRNLFEEVLPEGQTPTGQKLDEILNRYIPRLFEPCAKPITIIVITDGVPTDDPEVVIVEAARRLQHSGVPPRRLGIQFVQIGDDPDATEALKVLDDGLSVKYGIRDMVDTTLYDPKQPYFRTETMVKILHGAMHYALDSSANPVKSPLEMPIAYVR